MTSQSRYNALQYELFREQAGALGVAGKQLRDALAAYARHVEGGGLAGQSRTEHLLNEVANKAYALLLQREFVGLVHNNMEWLIATFDLPPEIWSRLGAQPGAASGRDV
jgi:hypothetical protein